MVLAAAWGARYTAPTPEPWRDRAACAYVDDPDLFFSTARSAQDDARAICAACSVKRECFDYAVRVDEYYGIWGGRNRGQREAFMAHTP